MDQAVEPPDLIEQQQKWDVQNQLPDNGDAEGEHGLAHGIEGTPDNRRSAHKG